MMDGLRYLYAVTAVVLVSGGSAAAQATPQQIVDQFYPAGRLPLEEPGDEPRSCFAVYSTTASGEPAVIMAGYTNAGNGVIRVIARNAGGSYGVAYELPASYDIIGAGCEVELPDLDMDGQRDVFVSFESRGGGTGWLFKWNGSALMNLTPTSRLGQKHISDLYNPEVHDLSHSGWLRVVCSVSSPPSQADEPKPAANKIYQSTGSPYARADYALDVTEFIAGTRPVAQVSHFRQSADSQGPFVLRVVNGDRLGQQRVTGGTIKLNGVVVVGPAQLTSATEFVDVTLFSLPIKNTFEVSLTGDPAAKIIVKVSDSTTRQ